MTNRSEADKNEKRNTKISIFLELSLIFPGAYRQKSAIWALVFKEFKVKLGDGRIGLFWALVEPIIGMLMISAIWYFNGRVDIHGIHVTLFIGSGFIIFIAVRQGINYIPYAISANQALLNYPQVKPIDTILARFVQSIWLHSLASILMLLSLWWILDVNPEFSDPLLCIEMIFTAMILSLGIALPLSVVGTLNPNVLKFVSIVSSPLMILSGVMYSMNELPTVAQKMLKWNPIVHLVAGFRAGAFGTKLFPDYNPSYPLFFGLTSLGFGYALYYRYRFKLLQK